jgi:peptide/nickel transport system substrate-binding protein
MIRRRELLLRGMQGASVVVAGGVLAACASDEKGGAKPVDVASKGGGKPIPLLRLGSTTEPFSMDYAKSYNFGDLLLVPAMTEPLFVFGEGNKLSPNLALSHSSPDPKRLVVKLRKGVKFHDGTAMTPEDVAFSMNRHLDPDVESFFQSYYVRVDHVEVTGDDEVTFVLKKPDAALPLALGTNCGAVTSKAFVERHGEKFGSPEVGTMGTGPYKYLSWTKGQETVIERFDGYWIDSLPRKVQRASVRVIKDEATMVSALRAGDIDGQILSLSGKAVATLADQSSLNVYEAPTLGAMFVAWAQTNKPWDDPRVRKALSLAVDRQGILDSVYADYGKIVNSLTPPSLWSFERETFKKAYEELDDFTKIDLEQAKALMEAADAKGAKGLIWCAEDQTQQQALAIQAAGKEIGLDLSIQRVAYGRMTEAIYAEGPKPYDMVIAAWQSDLPDPQNTWEIYFGEGVVSIGDFDYPELRETLNRSRESSDPHERATLISEVQAKVVNEQIMSATASPSSLMVLRSDVGGYELSGLWYWDPHMLGRMSAS